MKRNYFRWMIALMLILCVLPVAAYAEEEGGACPHNWVHVDGYNPSCTTPGLSDGEQCSLCSVWSYPQNPVAPLNHYIVSTDAKEPTCTEDGCGLGEACSRCGEVIRVAPVIPKLGHQLAHVDGTSNQCQEGKSDGEKCTREGCGYWSIPQVTVAAVHQPEVVPAVAQTCETTGLTEGLKCSNPNCNAVLKAQEVIPAHFPTRVAGKAPTCQETGLTDGTKCSSCSAVLVEQQTIGTISCDWVHVPGKAPSCVEEGKADAEVCSMCKTVNLGGQTLPSLGGHKWDEGKVTTAPTCHSAGVMTYTCGNAGCTVKTKTGAIPATGAHVYNVSKDRIYHYIYCINSGCKEAYAEQHTYGRWKVIRVATPEKKGVLKKTCTLCDHALWSNYEYTDNPPTSDAVVIPALVMLMSATALPVAVHQRRKRK